MNAQNIAKSKGIKIAASVLGIAIITIVIFEMGIAIGFKKARHSFKFVENYERNFMGEPFYGPTGKNGPGPRETMRDFGGRGFRNAHGAAGEIISISDNVIVIKDRDGQENTISVSDRTLIKRGQDTISVSDLENGSRIVVIGKPGDDGTVDADLIRVFYPNENE